MLKDLMREGRIAGASVTAAILFSVYLMSLPPKWATLHISGFLLVLSILYANRETWRCYAMRIYVLITCAWLAPVAMSGLWQNLIGLETATTWSELLRLVLRMLGIGMGIIVLLQRGWLSLRGATIAVMSILIVNMLAGYVESALVGVSLFEGWRAFRMSGLASNPNPFGTFMALTVVLTAGLLREKSRNIMLWCVLALALFAVWASGSRGAIVSAVAGLFVLFLPRNRRGMVMFAAGVLITGAGLLAYALSEYKYSSGDALRAEAIIFSVEKVLEAPLHGWGKEAFPHLPGKPGVDAPHNMLLDLAVACGLVPVAGWLLSMAWLSARLVHKDGEAGRVALAVLAATALAGFLEYSLLNSTHFRGIWVLVTVFACWVVALPAATRVQGKQIMDNG